MRVFHPPNRLRGVINNGGLTFEKAMERADAALETIRADCESAIDKKIEAIAILAQQPASEHQAIHSLANEIYAEAGAFNLNELSEAALSLCSLLGLSIQQEARIGIKVHVDTMRALRHPGLSGDAAGRAAVLQGLHDVTARYAVWTNCK